MPKHQSGQEDELEAEETQSGDSACVFDPTAACEKDESKHAIDIGVPISKAQYDALKEKAAKPKRATDPQSDQSTA